MAPDVRLLGIVNLTRDSFSDGGRFPDADGAIACGRALARDGAYAIDLGAESTHPDAESVSADEEIARLAPVIRALTADGIRVSVDTHKAQVMRAALALGAEFVNDVSGMRYDANIEAVRESGCRLIVMHARHTPYAPPTRAERIAESPAAALRGALEFLGNRIEDLVARGIRRERIIVDPGMGFFLSANPRASLHVLCEIDRLLVFGCPVLVSVSRKSFLGAALESPDAPRPVSERAYGTLAAELWAAQHGATYIRTHDVAAARDALRVWGAIAAACAGEPQNDAGR